MIQNIGIFKQLGMALSGLVKPSMYSRLRHQGAMKILLFVLTISLISSAITLLTPTITFVNSNTYSDFIDNLPEFSMGNGILELPEPYVFQQNNGIAVIDTTVTAYTNSDINSIMNTFSLSSSSTIILGSSTNILVYQSGQVSELSIADFCSLFKIDYLDNNNINDYLSSQFPIIFTIITLIGTLYYAFAYYVVAILYAVIGTIFGVFTKTLYSFKQHYIMGIYIAAFWKLLSRPILLFTDLSNKPVFLAVILLTSIYICLAQIKKEDSHSKEEDYVPYYRSTYNDSDNEVTPESTPTAQESSTNNYSQSSTPTSSYSGKFKLKD